MWRSYLRVKPRLHAKYPVRREAISIFPRCFISCTVVKSHIHSLTQLIQTSKFKKIKKHYIKNIFFTIKVLQLRYVSTLLGQPSGQYINLLKSTGHVMHQQFNIQQLYVLPTLYFVFIWEQTATCATYSINWLVFITEMKNVYCVVRTGSLNKAVCASSLKG